MIIPDISTRFRRHSDLLRTGSDALAYVLLVIRNQLSGMVTTLVPNFGLPTVHQDIVPLTMELQQQIDMENICCDVHKSIASFNGEQQNVFYQIVGAFLTGVTFFDAINISISIPPANPTLFLSPSPTPSAIHPPSSYPSRMFLLMH